MGSLLSVELGVWLPAGKVALDPLPVPPLNTQEEHMTGGRGPCPSLGETD